MPYRARDHLPTLVGTGLLLGMLGGGCGASTADEHGGLDELRTSKASLLRAQDCDDLLEKLQADAIIKVKLEAARALAQYVETSRHDQGKGEPIPGLVQVDESADQPERQQGDLGDGDNGDEGGFAAPPTIGTDGDAVAADSNGLSSGQNASGGDGDEGPTGASNTNTQVEGVDEADFVKVVKLGESMFVLNGSTLFKVKTWPAAETSLSSSKLVIEGSATEMFVTESGKAVVFSTVNGYGDSKPSGGMNPVPVNDGDDRPVALAAADIACAPALGISVDGKAYGGCGGYYQPFTKITVADVSGAEFKTERELYYEGNYVSSRRYGEVVRVVLQAQASYQFLQVDYYDENYQPLSRRDFEGKLRARVQEAEVVIRKKTIADWLPSIQEAKEGKLAELAPSCANFFVPVAGLSDYGLTHVLSLDLAHGNEVGGVTIMGSAQTVYSNLDSLVLAQPDYRWGPQVDFGFVDEQQLNVHLFSIEGAETNYEASGSVSGMLPPNNPQFGVDVEGSVLRLATTGRKRANPTAEPESPEFWLSNTTNQVYTLEQQGKSLTVLGKSENLGHANESVQSARFVGDRAYVVTFQQKDPLVVLDVENPRMLKVLGQIEIPGFSQYMHPLDENHLITVGQSGNWGVQLQLFDVTDPSKLIPPPKVLDFGQSSSSEAQYNHKALTFFAEQNLLAMPLFSYGDGYSSNFSTTLQLVKVDPATGFTAVGNVDHSELYQTQTDGCVQCYDGYCEYVCYNYQPEVRRGHFVTSEKATYVYSFSYAGVIVNDLANLDENLAEIHLPAPTYDDGQSWYGNLGGESITPSGTTRTAGTDNVGTDSATKPVESDGGAAIPAG